MGKKIAIVIAVLLAALAAYGIIKLIPVFKEVGVLNTESKQFVDTVLQEIVRDWNKDTLLKHASPGFLKAAKDVDLDQYLATVKEKIGKLKEYRGPEGGANINVSSTHGKVITAGYVACPVFENGRAEIKVGLIKNEDEWQIEGFNVDFPLIP